MGVYAVEVKYLYTVMRVYLEGVCSKYIILCDALRAVL